MSGSTPDLITVAVDAMGGDDAPAVVVAGAIQALKADPGKLKVILVGIEENLQSALADYDSRDLNVEVVHAPEVIAMSDSPAVAVKTKTASSLHVGLGLLKAGKADAFASAGNTGATMAASLFALGRIEGVSRPSIAGLYPTTSGASLVLDMGANVDCKPEHLVQFARMGTVYAKRILHLDNPSVALMNVGEEPGKGNELAKAAFAQLSESPGLHFVGNIEGRDLMHHAADVVVCDGFVGNVMLKLSEGVVSALFQMVHAQVHELGLTDAEKAVLGRVLGSIRGRLDHEEYGGAPLLGVKGNVMIGHGGSSTRAIQQLIASACEMALQDVGGALTRAMSA